MKFGPEIRRECDTYYQWPGVWNILTFGYILPQPLHSRPPNFVQLWIRISWAWIYFLLFYCAVVEADGGFPVVEGNCFRRLKWLSHRSHIQLSDFDRVNWPRLSAFIFDQPKITLVTLTRQRIEIHWIVSVILHPSARFFVFEVASFTSTCLQIFR